MSDDAAPKLLADLLIDAAAAEPGRAAVRCMGTELTYAELDDLVGRLTSYLVDEVSIEPGDRVAILLPNVPEFAIVYQAIQRAGAVVVPMNVLLKRREIEYYLGDSGASLLFAWEGFAEEARAAAEEVGTPILIVQPESLDLVTSGIVARATAVRRQPDDLAVLLYTSGTTGQPKGAELTHRNMVENALVSTELFSLTPDSVFLGALPLFHSFGQTCAMNASMTAAATLVLLPRFDPAEALRLIEDEDVSVFAGVPTMYGAMLEAFRANAADVSSLEVCVSGGASLPVELLRNVEDAFGCIILEGYGLSETSPVASFNHPGRERKAGTIGTPIRGVEMRVVDEHDNDVAVGEVGEILIRGHNVMSGYWERPDATAEALRGGWFHSGDLATMDEDGYFAIVDRSKDLIIRGGMNVYPREIEEVLYEHPAVLEAAVLGVPDEHLGQEVGAAIVMRAGETVSAEDISEWVKERLAAFKYPRVVWFLDELPKTATGKILKREIDVPASVEQR